MGAMSLYRQWTPVSIRGSLLHCESDVRQVLLFETTRIKQSWINTISSYGQETTRLFQYTGNSFRDNQAV